MRYFIRFSYQGTNYHGSQTQPNGITVQEVMEQCLATILRCPAPIVFAGRTDAGVHAEEMWGHFDYAEQADAEKLVVRMNGLLPTDIAVQQIVPVVADAHARFDAIKRTYQYYIYAEKNPFLEGRATRVNSPLDIPRMNEASKLLLGRHDFASFCKLHTDVKTTFCNVSEAYWEETTQMGNTASLRFTITADRFLRNMVRAVVGTLLDVGRGKITIDDFRQIIDAKNRCAAGHSAAGAGLYLTRVAYPPELFL